MTALTKGRARRSVSSASGTAAHSVAAAASVCASGGRFVEAAPRRRHRPLGIGDPLLLPSTLRPSRLSPSRIIAQQAPSCPSCAGEPPGWGEGFVSTKGSPRASSLQASTRQASVAAVLTRPDSVPRAAGAASGRGWAAQAAARAAGIRGLDDADPRGAPTIVRAPGRRSRSPRASRSAVVEGLGAGGFGGEQADAEGSLASHGGTWPAWRSWRGRGHHRRRTPAQRCPRPT